MFCSFHAKAMVLFFGWHFFSYRQNRVPDEVKELLRRTTLQKQNMANLYRTISSMKSKHYSLRPSPASFVSPQVSLRPCGYLADKWDTLCPLKGVPLCELRLHSRHVICLISREMGPPTLDKVYRGTKGRRLRPGTSFGVCSRLLANTFSFVNIFSRFVISHCLTLPEWVKAVSCPRIRRN